MSSLLVRTIRFTHVICTLHIRYTFSANSLIIHNTRSAAESGGNLPDIQRMHYESVAIVLRLICECVAEFIRNQILSCSKSWERKDGSVRMIANMCGCCPNGFSIRHECGECLANTLKFFPQIIRNSS